MSIRIIAQDSTTAHQPTIGEARVTQMYGSVADYVTNHGIREFSMTDLIEAIPSKPTGAIKTELNNLLADGIVVATSRLGPIQRYRAASQQDVLSVDVPQQKSGKHEVLLGDPTVTKWTPSAPETADARRLRLQRVADRVKGDLATARATVATVNQQIAAARGNRALLADLEGKLATASQLAAKKQRELNDLNDMIKAR